MCGICISSYLCYPFLILAHHSFSIRMLWVWSASGTLLAIIVVAVTGLVLLSRWCSPTLDFASLNQSLKVTLLSIAYMSALPRTSEQFRMSLWSSGGAAPGPRKPPRLLQHGDQTAKVNTGVLFLHSRYKQFSSFYHIESNRNVQGFNHQWQGLEVVSNKIKSIGETQ